MTPDAIYCDGGCVGPNPSPHGITWAWCWVAGEELVRHGSGLFTPDDFGLPSVTNNHAELIAAVRALESVPRGWGGVLHTDSQVTVNRLGLGGAFKNVPQWLKNRVLKVGKKPRPYKIILVGGHPTNEELCRGSRARNGLPVSVWNVFCDNECTRLAREFRRGLE